MTSSNHTTDRALQRDARAWQNFTGVSYTTALRELEEPLVQGILGDRVSARDLIRVLEEHPIIGDNGEVGPLDARGIRGDVPMTSLAKKHLFREVVLSTELLRMFSTGAENQPKEDWAHSYTLKHTAEHFFRGASGSYVSNGAMIWAAAYLGLPITPLYDFNVSFPVPKLEHHYVRRMHKWGEKRPKGHQYRPPRYTHLRGAIDSIFGRDNTPAVVQLGKTEASPFHEWLLQQKNRGVEMDVLVGDYEQGIIDSDHGFAADPAGLMDILRDIGADFDYCDAAESLGAEWKRKHSNR